MMTFDDGGTIAYLTGLMARMANMQPVMAEIGEEQASLILHRIMQEKKDPDGHAWAAWLPSTRDHRARSGNIGQGLLWDEGTLLHSITVNAGSHSVEIGSDAAHAIYLQGGTKRMEAREFIGWGKGDELRAEHRVVQYLAGINT